MVRGNIVCDLMALNKLELLPWDVNPVWGEPQDKHTQEALTTLDKVAEMSENPDEHFAPMRVLYQSDPRLTMPAGWKP